MNRNTENKNFLGTVMQYLFAATLVFTVSGVLALPIVLSVVYGWWWMFLYPVYLLSIGAGAVLLKK